MPRAHGAKQLLHLHLECDKGTGAGFPQHSLLRHSERGAAGNREVSHFHSALSRKGVHPPHDSRPIAQPFCLSASAAPRQVGFPTSFCFLVVLLYHLLRLGARCLPLRGFAHLQSCAFPGITLLQRSELSGAREELTLQGFTLAHPIPEGSGSVSLSGCLWLFELDAASWNCSSDR